MISAKVEKNNGDKYFMWTTDFYEEPIYGPVSDSYGEKLIGRKLYHSAQDLLKIIKSETLKKRINSAKFGTIIKNRKNYYKNRKI